MAEGRQADSLRYLDTRRLRMIAADTRLVSTDLEGRKALSEALGVPVPDNWPPELYDRNAMAFALEQLTDPAEQGWSFWYLHYRSPEEEQLVGIAGFKGRPDPRGSVEIGYSVLAQHRNRGLATEAVQGLVAWAFGHQRVTEVCAETLPYLSQSIGVLKNCGFTFAGPGSEHGVVRYVLPRSRLR